MPETDLLAALGALVAAQDPPSAALDEAALCLVDTLACILAGRDEDVAVAARRAMASASGPGPARAIGGDARMSLPAAALANGVAAHAIDLDDYEIPGSTHPSAVVLGALLALATTRAATLREVLVAHVAGHEAIVRMGEALGHGHYLAGWHATSTIGPFGAATACPRLLGLGAEATAHALGLAASASAGLKHQFGSDAKPVHAGFAARAGLEAALLAAEGIGAAARLFEGRHPLRHAGLAGRRRGARTWPRRDGHPRPPPAAQALALLRLRPPG
ncbi:MAG: MmgE/PrpD family protein, partial [Alphaproteobacteria bacterium]|nr:MmgE/PrpD family protein [Alphaproteobacteria bacterium]